VIPLLTKSWVGFLAGLSVGITCISLCLPVFLPVLLSQKRSLKESWLAVLKFSLGRLSGYLFFGFIFSKLNTAPHGGADEANPTKSG